MIEANIAFPVYPKDNNEAVRQEHGFESVNFAWQAILSAAAQADKRMNSFLKPEERGINTETVNSLLVQLQQTEVDPLAIESFYPYINGEVYANWGMRDIHNEHHRRERFFGHRARIETLRQAELDDDINQLFLAGIDNQEVSGYFIDMIEGIAELIPNDDFPYRILRSRKDVSEFWEYLIKGNENRPGIIETAVTLENQHDIFIGTATKIFGRNNAIEAMNLAQVILYMKTTQAKSSETARQLLVPLMKSFNTHDIDQIRTTIRDFTLHRPELIHEGFDEVLGINREEESNNIYTKQQEEENSKQRKLGDLLDRVSGNDNSTMDLSESFLDGSANRYVKDNRWRTFISPKNRESFVLVDIEDRTYDRTSSLPSMGVRLRFLKLDKDGRYEAGVHYKYVAGKKFFSEISKKAIVAGLLEPRQLEDLALAMGEEHQLARNLLEFLNSLND